MSDKVKQAVYDLKQAERIKGKFEKKNSVSQGTYKVSKEYAEKYNENFDYSGSFYELNKEENDKFLERAKNKKPELFEEESKPIGKMTVDELKLFLTENSVDFSEDEKKADLLEKARNVEQ